MASSSTKMGTWWPTSAVTGTPTFPPSCTNTRFVGSPKSKKNTKKTKRNGGELCKDKAEGEQAKSPPLKRFNQSSDGGSDGGSDDNLSCEWCHRKVSSADDLATHFCTKHWENTCLSQCRHCLLEETMSKRVAKKVAKKEKHGFFPCSKCGKICKLAPGLAMHMKFCGETTEERRQMREEEERRVSILTRRRRWHWSRHLPWLQSSSRLDSLRWRPRQTC